MYMNTARNNIGQENESAIFSLKKLVDVCFFSLIPLLVLCSIIGILSHSISISLIAFDYGISLVVQLFFFKAIRTMMRSNSNVFPYGTGKIENFSALLYGALAVPAGLFFIYSSILRLIDVPHFISFSLAQIPLIPNLIRSSLLLVWAKRLMKRFSSPMIHSYYINFKVTTMFDIGILGALFFAFVLARSGQTQTSQLIAYSVDPILCLAISSYMLISGLRLTVQNFKVLTDFPLSEGDQLKIMRILAHEYECYENIGNIYTRYSGSKRLIELELYFKKETPLEKIIELRDRIENLLKEDFADFHFSLIPLHLP